MIVEEFQAKTQITSRLYIQASKIEYFFLLTTKIFGQHGLSLHKEASLTGFSTHTCPIISGHMVVIPANDNDAAFGAHLDLAPTDTFGENASLCIPTHQFLHMGSTFLYSPFLAA